MGYVTPKTNWDTVYEPSPGDLNRIEGNVKHIKSEEAEFDEDKTFNDDVEVIGGLTAGSVASVGAVSGTTGTFSGAVSGTTGTFSGAIAGTTLNTGQGANELYGMDQGVKVTDNVTHNDMTINGALKPNITSAGDILFNRDPGVGKTWTISRGVYLFARITTLNLEINNGAGWYNVSTGIGGLVFSDGVNVRLYDPIGGGGSVLIPFIGF